MKVQINLNDDLVKKIDDFAKQIGMTRSALCATWIGYGVLGIDKAMDICTPPINSDFINEQ